MEETTFDDFYKEDFDIDDFLNKQTENNDLKEILVSLNEMKNKNSNKMTTVLREKTDAVILIAEQLQSLYKKIDNLQSPLAQLKEEVQILVKRVHDVVSSFDTSSLYSQNISASRQNLTAIRSYKVVLEHSHKLMKNFMNHDEVDFEAMERLICKYAFHACVLNKLNIATNDGRKHSLDISIKLLLRDTFLKAHSAGNASRVTRIIDMFVYLNMVDMLKEIVCDDIVKPKVAAIFCEENLRACGNDMSLVYGQALRVLEHDLKMLIGVIRKEKIHLDIILDCYWSVVDKLLRTNLITITAAGHPDAFFQHFNDTHAFLKEIGVIHGTPDLYKQNQSFIEHLKRFNLLVYYEIRHQYVSSSFELVVLKCSDFSDIPQAERICRTKSAKHNYGLKVSLALNVLIDYLFSKNVFMPIISEQFTKSAMLLTSRYATWIQDTVIPSLMLSPRGEVNIAFAVCLINDLRLLTSKLIGYYDCIDGAVDLEICLSLKTRLTEDFRGLYRIVADYLIDYHLSKMKDDLKNVSDIPRLYRKTNRTIPQQASLYIKDSFKEVEVMNKMLVQSDGNLKESLLEKNSGILLELLQSATKEYNTMVFTVLNAVSKTEESLKRLKSRSLAASETTLQGSTDEAKIRLQIKLDVQQFVQIVRGFNIGELETDLQSLLLQIEHC